MPTLVLTILIFVGVGASILAANLILGRLLRPDKPTPAKGITYECGEVPVGSAWGQFDIRFYVVALLFVVFDVELVFFFPWALVFGQATRLSHADAPVDSRMEAARNLDPALAAPALPDPDAMRALAWIAFADILVFFGVLLVGFAYLWSRGDLDWVRSVAAQRGVRLPTSAEWPRSPALDEQAPLRESVNGTARQPV